MIKIDLITGFLGSGKTTFLKKYAAWLVSRGEKIGILENDLGPVNVDMMLLKSLEGENCELEMISGGLRPGDSPEEIPDQADRYGNERLRPGSGGALRNL